MEDYLYEVREADPSGYWILPEGCSSPECWLHMESSTPINEITTLRAKLERLESVVVDIEGGEPLTLLDELDAAKEQNDILRAKLEGEVFQHAKTKADLDEAIEIQHCIADEANKESADLRARLHRAEVECEAWRSGRLEPYYVDRGDYEVAAFKIVDPGHTSIFSTITEAVDALMGEEPADEPEKKR